MKEMIVLASSIGAKSSSSCDYGCIHFKVCESWSNGRKGEKENAVIIEYHSMIVGGTIV